MEKEQLKKVWDCAEAVGINGEELTGAVRGIKDRREVKEVRRCAEILGLTGKALEDAVRRVMDGDHPSAFRAMVDEAAWHVANGGSLREEVISHENLMAVRSRVPFVREKGIER